MVSGQDQEEKHFHEKRVKLIIKIIITFGTARGIAKSEIRKQQKRQGRDVRASIAEKINTYLRIYPSATQTQGKWKKNIMIFSAKTFFPSARRHQHYLFISLYFSAAFYCIFNQNQDVIFPENDQLPPTAFDYIPTRVTPVRMRNWSENDSFLHRNRFTNGKQLSH